LLFNVSLHKTISMSVIKVKGLPLNVPKVNTKQKDNTKKIVLMPIKGLLSTHIGSTREAKELKVCFQFIASEHGIMVKFQDMMFGIRKSGNKYETHSKSITDKSDIQYVGLICSILRKTIKDLPDIYKFRDMVEAAFHKYEISDKGVTVDTVIPIENESVNKWLTETYPFIPWAKLSGNRTVSELHDICEGYDKICYDLTEKGATAQSIRILHGRIRTDIPEVKAIPAWHSAIDNLPLKLSDKALVNKVNNMNLNDKDYKRAIDRYNKRK